LSTKVKRIARITKKVVLGAVICRPGESWSQRLPYKQLSLVTKGAINCIRSMGHKEKKKGRKAKENFVILD